MSPGTGRPWLRMGPSDGEKNIAKVYAVRLRDE